MTSILKLVGTKIRDTRIQKGWSQEVLGEKASFHYSYIGGVERGEKNISLLNLEKIATALNVEIYQLFSYSEILTDLDLDKEATIHELLQQLLRLNQKDLKKVKVVLKEFLK